MPRAGRWGVFLDRDGTLLRLVPYLHEAARTRLYDGVGPALRVLREAGAHLVVVTNQSGIARGLFTGGAMQRVHREMSTQLARHGVLLDAIEVCPHLAEITGPCSCRKPAPGLITRAARRLGIDLARSWTIGDNASDLGAARAAGTQSALVLTGYGRRTRRARAGGAADLVGVNLGSVVRQILAARGEAAGQRPEGRGAGVRKRSSSS